MHLIKRLRILLLMATPLVTGAQDIQITNGCHFIMSGPVKLVLRNAGINNNGIMVEGNSTVLFTANQDVRVAGNNGVRFNNVNVSKTDGKALIMENDMRIAGTITFSSGHVLLNGHTIDLASTGSISGERNASRINGINGGAIKVIRIVNNTFNELNPGNIGVELSTSTFFPSQFGITVTRRYNPEQLGDGARAIKRSFDILMVPTNLNGTVRFHYFNAELNGLDESTLTLFQRVTRSIYTPINSVVDTATNTITATGLNVFNLIAAGSFQASPLRNIQDGGNKTGGHGIFTYPNPARDQFTLQMTSKQAKNITLRLYDQSGRVLQEKRMEIHIGTNIIPWKISSYAAGVYYIASENNEVKNIKVIKE